MSVYNSVATTREGYIRQSDELLTLLDCRLTETGPRDTVKS